MGDEVRTSDVQKGDDSIVRYVEARALAGRRRRGRGGARDLRRPRRLQPLRLRLDPAPARLARRPRARGRPAPVAEPRARRARLRAVGRARSRSPPLALQHPEDSRRGAVAAPRRGRDRLLPARGEDASGRRTSCGCASPSRCGRRRATSSSIDPARCRVVEDWHFLESGRGGERRILELRGELAPGTRLSEGSNPFALYELPAPYPFEASPRWIHSYRSVTVVEVLDDGALVEETAVDGVTWSRAADRAHPRRRRRARATSRPRSTRGRMPSSTPRRSFPADPATDILRRRPPRTRRRLATPAGGLAARRPGDDVDAIVRAVARPRPQLPRRAGPSGHRQDLRRVARDRAAGAGARLQGRRRRAVARRRSRTCSTASSRRGSRARRWRKAPKDPSAAGMSFTAHRRRTASRRSPPSTTAAGFVVGGTAWDFSHEGRVPRGSLDLLVDRRGRPVLARLDDRRVARRAAAAAARRPAAAAAGEPGHPPRAGRHVGARLGHGRRRRHPARVRLLPRSHLAHASRGRRAGVAAVVPRRARGAPVDGAAPARRASRPGVAPDRRCATTATPRSRSKRRPRSSSTRAAICIGRDVDRMPHRRRDGAIDSRCRRARSSSATSSS